MTTHGSPERVSLDALLAHRAWVRALARRLVTDENDADDVEQETWRMAVERPPRHDSSLRGWLAAVARNAARMGGRGAARRARYEAAAPARAATPSPEELVAAAELQTRLARAVLDLDEPYRSTVLYRFHEGLEASEIAARLGVPVETVRTRLKRAVERLRERMDADVGDDRDAWCLLLVGVRADRLGPLAPGAAAGASAAAVAGGLAMAAGTKTIAAVAVIAVAGGAWWLAARDDSPPKRDATSVAAADALPAPAPLAAGKRVHAAAPSADEEPTASSQPATPEKGLVVHGRVLDDETGAPVAGVAVSLVWARARRDGEPSATTATDGAFRIAGAEEGTFGDILLRADGYAETITGLPWRDVRPAPAKGDAGDLRIFRGKRVTGRALRADGVTPAAGARIHLSGDGGSTSNMWFNAAREWGKCGDDGRFALERVPPNANRPYTLFAVAEGGIGWTTLAGVAGRADATDVEVRLREPAAATVTVRDGEGGPCADATVLAAPRFEPLGSPSYWSTSHDAWLADGSAFAPVFRAKTDAAGVARFTLLPSGDEGARYDFIAHSRATASTNGVILAPGREAQVTIVFSPPDVRSVVAGVRVVDGDDKPVEGATLTVRSGPRGATATTGPDGVAIFERKQGEPSTEAWGWFDVAKDGFAKTCAGVRFVRDDGTPLPAVRLSRPAAIDGRVVDQDGKPVHGCYVDLLGQGAPPSTQTNADGRFAFADATAGEWTLRYMPPQPFDEWVGGQHQALVHGGDRELVVVLRRLPAGKATLVASIVDADTGAKLAPDEAMLMPDEWNDEPVRSADAAVGLGDGTVTFPRMRPGRWQLWVRVPGRGAALAFVDVAPGQTEVSARVEVGRPGRLRGRVETGETGPKDVHWVSIDREGVWSTPQWGGYQTAKVTGGETVAGEGSFVFEKLMPGRYRLHLETPDGWVGEALVDVPSGGDAECVVTLVRGGIASFRFATAMTSKATVRIDVARAGESWRCVASGTAARDAKCGDATLAPGSYRWRMTIPDEDHARVRPAEGEITVVAGETAVVEVPVVAK
jgi:RNA polymerase sigma-70 factor (ECF subfamily)